MTVKLDELVGVAIDATTGTLGAFGEDEAARLVAAGREGAVRAVTSVVPEPIDPWGLADAITDVVADILRAAGQSLAATMVRAGTALLQRFLATRLTAKIEGDSLQITILGA